MDDELSTAERIVNQRNEDIRANVGFAYYIGGSEDSTSAGANKL
jgi:hypothetical protein